MKILSIETSCDETSAAVVERKVDEPFVRVLSNVTASSLAIHATTGGIIPENAAREQVKYIIPTITKALNESRSMNYKSWENALKILANDIDAIAVTYGPGLIGSLLVGVETAKTLSFVFNKPIVPVNHLLAHLFANWIISNDPLREARRRSNLEEITSVAALPRDDNMSFPIIGLIVSGGHTDLLLFKSLNDYKWIGGTLDDAAGEALDKIGRLLNLPYPAGPEIERRANKVKKTSIKFTSPIINSDNFDFSFSGLKAEVSRFVQKEIIDEKTTNEICYATQIAIFDVLIKKTIKAAEKFDCQTIILGGGVSANQTLRREFESRIMNQESGVKIFVPEQKFATDNAAMIGAYALLNYRPTSWEKVEATPELYL